MSRFTMTLNEAAQLYGLKTVKECSNHPEVFGLDLYPIHEEDHRCALNEMIIRRYWNREIGQETWDMFKFTMSRRMFELMPYYNQLYASTQLKFDPMKTISINNLMDRSGTLDSLVGIVNNEDQKFTSKETGKTSADETHEESSTNKSTSESDNKSRTVSSTTPQNQLSGNGDYADSMADAISESDSKSQADTSGEGSRSNEATSVDDTTSNRNTDSKTDSDRADKTTDKMKSSSEGYQAVPSNLLKAYRETFLNIDLMILGELGSLFMALYSTDDEYFQERYSPYGTSIGF